MTKQGPLQRIKLSVRFSVRTMLGLILAAGLCLAMFSSAERQRRAVARIVANGGWVKYEYQLDGSTEPYGPEWLRSTFGVDCFNRVMQASVNREYDLVQRFRQLDWLEVVSGERLDDQLRFLERKHNLRVLHVRGPSISEHGLASLSRLSKLEVLNLGGAKLRGVSLVVLHQLPELKELVLAHTDADESELRHLGALPRLEKLKLTSCKLSTVGTTHIMQNASLRELGLQNTGISDASAKLLSRLDKLEHLDLSFTNVGDAGAGYLSSLRNLRELKLSGTKISDVAISRLGLNDLSQLHDLHVDSTRVSAADVERIGTAYRNMRIYSNHFQWPFYQAGAKNEPYPYNGPGKRTLRVIQTKDLR